jgi:endonuclease VIII
VPEGDTVYRTAKRLREALVGQEVTRFDIRVPRSAVADLRGEQVTSVIARGKHLLERIGGYSLHSHLKMEGRWDVYAPGGRWRRPAHSARAIVSTSRAETVGFDLAMVEVLPTSEEDRVVGHLGPDPLADDWDPLEAARLLGADTRPVHVALLDQRNVAGFGNEYANEILFVRGVAPTRPASEVDVAALLDVGTRMIRANLPRAERTFTGDSRPGRRTWVYRRDGKPCRRCGTPIRAGALGANETSERNVFWCPVCQRA